MKIAILGNCQARPLATILKALSPEVDIPTVGIVHLLHDDDEGQIAPALAAADVIVAQQVAPNYPCRFVTTERLREQYGNKVLSIINLYFSGYNPELMYLRVPGLGTVQGPLGDYHFRPAFEAWGRGASVEEALAELASVELNEARYRGVAHASLSELKRREQLADVGIVDHIEEHWTSSRLFHTMNHPVTRLLQTYGQRLARQLGLRTLAEDSEAAIGEPLGAFRLPANPWVRAELLDKAFQDTDGLRGLAEVQEHGRLIYRGMAMYSQRDAVEGLFRVYDRHRAALKHFMAAPGAA